MAWVSFLDPEEGCHALGGDDGGFDDAGRARYRPRDDRNRRGCLHRFVAVDPAGPRVAGGDLAGAEAAFADVLALVERDLPDEALTRAAALHNLAAVRADLGQFVQAEAMARAALDIRRRLGEAGAIASSERLLGTILHDLGQLDEARALIEASVVAQLNDANVPRVSLEK